MARCLQRLHRGQIEAVVKILRDLQPTAADLAKIVSNEAGYFERNAQRMRFQPSERKACLSAPE